MKLRRLYTSMIGGGCGLAVALGIIVSSTRLLAIVALVVNLLLLIALAGSGLVALRYWSKVQPALAPLLSMFAPPAVGAEPVRGGGGGREPAPVTPADIQHSPYSFPKDPQA